jgi:hypothetical protein
MVRFKKTTPKPRLFPRSFTLTPTVDNLLSQDAKDYTGQAVSSSAILRALVHYADQQGEEWIRSQIFPLIEQELSAGVIWGKKR